MDAVSNGILESENAGEKKHRALHTVGQKFKRSQWYDEIGIVPNGIMILPGN